ncbi:MAG TPA: hypothetical protein PLV68_12385, partial [Ilumatobacteraceae bacterium]|nr:hypothetical protein [Ilumatobacteraceae bacterium]
MMRHDHESLGEATTVHAGSLGDGTIDVLARLADWTFYVTALTSVVGLGLLGRRRLRKTRVQSMLLTAGYLLAIPLGLWGSVRFHAPLIPFIVLLAAFAVDALQRRVRGETTAGQLDAPGEADVVEQGPVVGDQQDGAPERVERNLELFD